MKFTADELKMLSLLKRQHAGWKKVRIIILACSLGMLLLSIRVLSTSKELPICAIVLAALAAYGLSYSVAGWSGRPEISLLLKLFEEHIGAVEKI